MALLAACITIIRLIATEDNVPGTQEIMKNLKGCWFLFCFVFLGRNRIYDKLVNNQFITKQLGFIKSQREPPQAIGYQISQNQFPNFAKPSAP